MIIVRMVFQASYGKGGELAAAMAASAKQVIAEMGGEPGRVGGEQQLLDDRRLG